MTQYEPEHSKASDTTKTVVKSALESEKFVKDSIEIEDDKLDAVLDSIEPIKFSKKDEKMVQATMRMAHTTSLRKAIDLFVKKQTANPFLEEFAAFQTNSENQKNLEELTNSKMYFFEDLYKQGYFTGKFIVMFVNDNIAGGVNLDIIFQHKQDKVFRFWMYYIADDDNFVVRAVYVPQEFDDKTVKFYRRLYAIYLNDESFGV